VLRRPLPIGDTFAVFFQFDAIPHVHTDTNETTKAQATMHLRAFTANATSGIFTACVRELTCDSMWRSTRGSAALPRLRRRMYRCQRRAGCRCECGSQRLMQVCTCCMVTSTGECVGLDVRKLKCQSMRNQAPCVPFFFAAQGVYFIVGSSHSRFLPSEQQIGPFPCPLARRWERVLLCLLCPLFLSAQHEEMILSSQLQVTW